MELTKFNVWIFLFVLSSILNLAFIGGFFNLIVVNSNDCLMPVYEPTSNTSITGSETHFYFNKSTNVSFFYLSDIFKIGRLYFSLGDIILTLSFFFTAGMDLILLGYYLSYRREKKDEKNKNSKM